MRKIYSLVLMAMMLLVGTNVWADPTVVNTWDELKTAINGATEDLDIQVAQNATLNYGTITTTGITIPAGITVNLDLNGSTLTGTKNGAAKTAFLILNLGTLHISNGTLVNNAVSGTYNRLVANYSKMVAENLNITVTQGVCLMSYWNSDTELTNCNFVSNHQGDTRGNSNDNACIEYTYTGQNYTATSIEASNYKLTINGGNYEGGWGGAIYCYYAQRVNINSGTFKNNNGGEVIVEVIGGDISMQGGSFNTDIERYLTPAYGYRRVNDMYVVEEISANNTHNISVSDFSQLQAAAESPSTYERNIITLNSNITMDGVVNLARQNTLVVGTGRVLNIVNGGVMNNDGSITNNGTINCAGYITNILNIEGNLLSMPENVTIDNTNKTISVTMQKAMDFSWLRYISMITEDIEEYWWTVSMENDITLPDAAFLAIPYFRGDFDGQGHSIRNLHIDYQGGSFYGMFVQMPEGSVKNVSFDKVDVKNGAGYVGIIAGHFNPSETQTSGLIFENINLSGSIVATGGSYGMGAIVGLPAITNSANVWFVNCVNNATITSAGYNTGAFIGSLTGTTIKVGFYNCKNNATIDSNNADNGYIGYGAAKTGSTLEIIACANVEGGTWITNRGSGPALTTTYADPTTYVAVWDETQSKYIAREIGEIVQPTSPTIDWAQNTTWTDGTQDVVPTASDAVEMTNNVEINNGTNAEAQSLTVANDATLTVKEGGTLEIGDGGLDVTNGTLIIEPGAEVRVNGEVISTSEDAITISSNGTDGTSVFVVNPDIQQTNIKAKIQLYTTARHETSPVDQYIYNYVGIPTSTAITSSDITREAVSGDNTEDLSMYLYGWNVQTGWQQGGWELLSQPFRGVALTSESTQGTIFTFEGTLVGNGDGQMNFNHKGFNFFANSYTAPINIQTLLDGFSTDVRATIYIYDSKDNRVKGVSRSDFAGYFTPAFTVIPSMQAFFVFTEEKNSVTEEIDYRQMVWNNTASNTPLNAPARLRDNGSFDRIRINVSSLAGANDQVQLVSEDRFSTEFDNGYDAVKFMNQGQANIYATTDEHSMQNLFTDNLEGVFIGFTANNDENTYVLSFDEVAGEQHAIKDLMNGRVTLMAAGNTYTFTQPEGTTFDHRFQIVDREEVVTSVENIDNTEIKAEGVYTITGQYVGTYDMWNNLPAGVYVVNGAKVVK